MKAPKLSSSKTLYYELLGVAKDAVDKDLKKAYRLKSLKLHPDKGGSEEEFKEMKYAYDVLMDTKKRKAYDQYGEAGVKMMEGNVSVEVAMQMFLSIGPCERFMLILMVTLIIGYLLLFPILLSIRWDRPKSMTFVQVFIPVWITLAFVLSFFLCCVHSPPAPEVDEEDECMRKEMEEQHQKQTGEINKLRFGAFSIIAGLTSLLVLLVLRLDGETHWSYFLVIWPWILMELGMFATKFYTAETAFLMTGHDPEVLQGKWLKKDWNLFLASFTCAHVFHIIFACLVALKLDEDHNSVGANADGMKLTWWEAFAPLWVNIGLGVVMLLMKTRSIKTEDELAGLTNEARATQDTCGSIVAQLIGQCMWLGLIVLVCYKLTHPSSFPAWVVFLPLFALGGCFCCCLSCFFCCMSPEAMKHPDDDEEKASAQPMPAPAAPMYGSVK